MNWRPLRIPFRQYIRWFGWRGLALYLQATFLAQTGEVRLRPPPLREPLTLRLGSSDFGFYGQIIVRAAYALPLCNPPRVIVDAGANIGLASVYFANRYPEARILALEPETSNFALLRKNCAAYPRITPIQVALWNQITELDLIHPAGRHGAFRTQPHCADQPSTVLGQVTATTIPHLMAAYSLEFIDLLKVDIEGAEREVFADATPWIGRVGVIIAELHDRVQRGCALNFYTATRGFDIEWHVGEHVCVAQREFILSDFLNTGLHHTHCLAK